MAGIGLGIAEEELIKNAQGADLASVEGGIGLAEKEISFKPAPSVADQGPSTTSKVLRALTAAGAAFGTGPGGRLARFAIGRGGPGRSKGKDPDTAKFEKFEQMQQTMQAAIKTSLSIEDSDERERFLAGKAEEMNSVIPRSGNALIAISRQPTVAENVSKFIDKSQTAQLSLQADPSGASLTKLMSTTDGMKTIVNETESAALPIIRKKISLIVNNAQQFGNEKISKRLKDNDSASVSDVIALNRSMRESDNDKFRKAALTDGELRIAFKNQQATYAASGVLVTTKDQEVRADRAKQGIDIGKIVDIPRGDKKFSKGIRDPKGSLFPDLPHENGFAIIGKQFEKGGNLGFSGTTFNAVGPDGDPIRVQVDKEGNTRILPFEPVVGGSKESLDEKILKGLLGGDDKPPQDVPQDVFDRFNKDPASKDFTLGPIEERTDVNGNEVKGYAVKNSKGDTVRLFK